MSKKDKESARDSVFRVIDAETTPKNMTKEEYREFLGELIADLEIRHEAVIAELEEG